MKAALQFPRPANNLVLQVSGDHGHRHGRMGLPDFATSSKPSIPAY